MLGPTPVALVADNVAALFGVRRAGASAWVVCAGVGAGVGLRLGLPGAALTAAARRLSRLCNSDAKKALRAGAGGFLGFRQV